MWNAMPSRVLTKPTREVVASLDQVFASLVMLSFRGHVYDQLSGQRPSVVVSPLVIAFIGFFNQTFRARFTLWMV